MHRSDKIEGLLFGGGVFLFFGIVARRGAAAGFGANPVPQALVITGIVVDVLLWPWRLHCCCGRYRQRTRLYCRHVGERGQRPTHDALSSPGSARDDGGLDRSSLLCGASNIGQRWAVPRHRHGRADQVARPVAGGAAGRRAGTWAWRRSL